MKAGQAKPADEMRMSGKAFDQIMGQALRVKPENAKKPKRSAKMKAAQKRKKAHNG
jgi:hypothetical protein